MLCRLLKIGLIQDSKVDKDILYVDLRCSWQTKDNGADVVISLITVYL